MVRAAALIALLAVFPSSAEVFDRAAIIKMSEDPNLASSKMIVATSSVGAVWQIRLSDLGKIYKNNSKYPTVWIFEDLSKVKTEKARSGRSQYDIDCENGRASLRYAVDYDPTGKVINTIDASRLAAEWTPIVPESMFDALREAVCPE